MSLTYKNRIFGLDVVRAIAISMVVMAHAMFIFKGYNHSFFDVLNIFGFLGVEIFFVLSGFLIGGILFRIFKSNHVSFKDVKHFWVRRWFRTLPLYFLFLILNVSIALLLGIELPRSLWKYVFFLQNFSEVHIAFFPESWSLSVEEFAYLLAPIMLLGFFKIPLKIRNMANEKIFLLASIFLVILFFLLKVFYHVNTPNFQSLEIWNSNLKAIVIYRLDAIFYGFIVLYYFKTQPSFIKKIKNKLFLMGIFMLFVVIIVLPSMGVTIENHPWYWNIGYLPLNSIAIAITLPYFYYLKNSSQIAQKMILNISLYSYSMYLFHYSFLLFLLDYVIIFEELDILSRIIWVLIYLWLVYVTSKGIYIFFEKPLTDLRDHQKIRKFLE
ncbi:MAG: acyltransferase [Flavobacteriales bacterium]|nr:acyltransferase [Flavobacteriales bacterium]NCQ14794.1 acyltransferase [Flavobacteriales bacterium]PIY10718.1 MAG: hypothetical protein COZ17_08965 [Flavobacteriaceae bacterium CG_4_10_14_3_um_filter_33_47]PJB19412.1 MAG: hypothetical protein CO117_04805 [Flavobacteriaceae bacterium CG_4_9_14_3_um_filter_33_16]